MKTISAELQSAILDKSSSSVLVKAIADPSRTFFASIADNNPYDAEDYGTPTDHPVGQCTVYSPYMDKLYTFIVDDVTGALYGMEQGSDTVHDLEVFADPNTKPSAIDVGNGKAHVYYWCPLGTPMLYFIEVDLATMNPGSSMGWVTYPPGDWTILGGSPTVMSENQVAFCYQTSKGGISVVLIDGNNWHYWNQRFMSPKAETSLDWTIYTSAAILNGLIYVYSTDIDSGDVRAVEYNPYKDTWSDIYIALPSDLSRFDITNAVVANGYVHLAGQYHRTGDLADSKVYSLILRSFDGKHFSWDRFTLLSNLGYQFNIAIDAANKLLYASDRNCVSTARLSYFFTSIPTNRVILEPPNSIISFVASESGGTLTVSGADEVYIDNTTLLKGNRIKIYIGYKTSTHSNGEYQEYGTYIIDGRTTTFKDGERSLTLRLINEGVWKTNQIAFPFYAEILSKSSLWDNCDEQDKMYVESCYSGRDIDFLVIDFWNSGEWDGDTVITDGDPYSWSSFPASEISTATNYQGATDMLKGKTVTLNAHPYMTRYPTILGTFTTKLYGWEHTEQASRANSTWTLYAVTAPEDDLNDKTVTAGTLTSTYQVFPQKYPDVEAGSYPIEFSFTGITAGHKLLYFGISNSNSSAGESEMYLERIEVFDIQFAYTQLTSSTAWSLYRPAGETRDYLASPDTSLQNMMFTTKPYSTFNFNVAAEFGYEAGDNPLSPGLTTWGVVGLAKDGFDYICARYSMQNSQLQLVLFRNGVDTILDTYNSSQINDIMIDHRNGLIRVWYKTTNIWTGPVISYQYDEITHGPMSTSTTGIMHTGVYAGVYPIGFICAAFSQPYSEGICLTTEQDKSILDGFPAAGKVWMNGTIYSYEAKTTFDTSTSMHYGPHQLRQVSNLGRTWTEGGITFDGIAIETALYAPTNNPLDSKYLLVGQSNYHNWLITGTDWTVEHSTAGVPDYLRNRSRHQTDDAIEENYYGASTTDKCFINHGLRGITIDDGDPYMHPQGSLCGIYSTDKIWVKKVVATQVDHDATVEDMISFLCHTACIEAEFPGNWTDDSFDVTSTPVELASDREVFPGGLDVRFTIPDRTLTATDDFIAITPTELTLTETEETMDFGFKNSNGIIQAYIKPSGTTAPEYINTNLSPLYSHDVRILAHNDFVSFYADDITLATFALGEENLTWPDSELTIKIYSNDPYTITNVKVSELFDWREAIYIESEMSASSAIGSVIQERPIEIYSRADGNLSFSYRFHRDTITYTTANMHQILHSHSQSEQNSDNAGSDALIYYSDIAFINNDNYAINDGFNTRVFRLSTLSSGAKTAARLILEKAYEKQKMHNIEIRPDMRLEVGDIVDCSYTASGTGRATRFLAIIESINITIQEGQHAMAIIGRDMPVPLPT